MNYEKLHDYSTGETQKIALIDSGISTYLDLDEKSGFSLVDDNIYDINGHGTMMYSIIKGYKKEILGISPDAEIISIKILDEEESVTPTMIYDAIKLAIKKEATIINLSVSSYKYNEKIASAIEEANQKNITVVSSSGDYSDTKMMFPANVNGVVSVGALGKDLKVLEMTSGADSTTINAPGGDINTIDTSKEVFTSSGTSQATALVSGYIALLKDFAIKENIELSNSDILHYLKLIKQEKMSYAKVFKEIK
ncbi:S8 family peptidase [Rossellomorea arthrocnemi]|uniref:S8 family peptidase n=1 Tax=Rossellomorea arthrocnemi TaxID=2769542 RepID=UPI00191B89D7|nr:S8/S53 family peptidase [Rossellomorea arthrocnemi]